MIPSIFLCATAHSLPSDATSDVKKACEKHGLSVIELQYRDRQANIDKIRGSDLGSSELAEFLRQYYSADSLTKNEKEQVLVANSRNRDSIESSELKGVALAYAGRQERLSDPEGYIYSMVSFTGQAIPSMRDRLRDFFNYRSPDLLVSLIQPATPGSTDFYGARADLFREEKSKKLVNLITISNNPSDSFPYLATLLIHELVHAENKLANFHLVDGPERERVEFAIVDEARAFDAQIVAYLEAVETNPELFCHWLYPTWSYGEIVVPLSWTMASMEREARSGSMIYNYAKSSVYKSHRYLLNKNRSHLRSDLQEQINKAGLRYVQ